MNRKDEEHESTAGAALELGTRLLRFGWTALKFAGMVVNRLLPAQKPPEKPPESGRQADRPLETEAEMDRDERWGTLFVLVCFAVAIVGGVLFVVFYWKGETSAGHLGTSLALFLGGLGFTSVVWARWMMPEKQAVEERHPLKSSPVERDDAAEAFCGGAREIRRRRLLQWMGLGATGVFGAMIISLIRSLGLDPYASLYSRVWKGGQRLVTSDGKPVVLSSLEPGSTVTVFPEDKVGSERAQTVLIRVKEDLLQLPQERSSWAPGGYVAYSRVCTHAGCPVGEYEAEQSLLLCPCHQSTFDVLRAAAPTGGPAARALPQLPLYADPDGTLRAGGGFSEPPGPGFWGLS